MVVFRPLQSFVARLPVDPTMISGALSTANPDHTPVSVTFNSLLSLYILVPITALAMGVDYFIFHGRLRATLPRNPEHLRAYTFLFVLPHVVASAGSFLDREYAAFYQRKLWAALVVAFALGILMPRFFGAFASLIIYVVYTMYHLITQQTGIAMFMTGGTSRPFYFWRWGTILASVLMYLLILVSPNWTGPFLASFPLRFFLDSLIIPLLIVMCAGGGIVGYRSRTSIGRWYVAGNCAMLVLTGFCYILHYSFFGVLLTRAIHDITGFLFYAAHDSNRNGKETPNLFYRLLKRTGLPIYLLCPIFGIALANTLLQLRFYPYVRESLMMLAYFHYYTEGFMWKRSALHRRFVPVIAGPALFQSTRSKAPILDAQSNA